MSEADLYILTGLRLAKKSTAFTQTRPPQRSDWLCGTCWTRQAGNRQAVLIGTGATAVIDIDPQLPGIDRLRAAGAPARAARAGTH